MYIYLSHSLSLALPPFLFFCFFMLYIKSCWWSEICLAYYTICYHDYEWFQWGERERERDDFWIKSWRCRERFLPAITVWRRIIWIKLMNKKGEDMREKYLFLFLSSWCYILSSSATPCNHRRPSKMIRMYHHVNQGWIEREREGYIITFTQHKMIHLFFFGTFRW